MKEICSSYLDLLKSKTTRPLVVFDGLSLPGKERECKDRARREIFIISRVSFGFFDEFILAGYYDFNANISFTFQAIKHLYAHPAYLCFGPFCKLFGDFSVYLEKNSFSQRISKIYGNRNFEDLVLFKK